MRSSLHRAIKDHEGVEELLADFHATLMGTVYGTAKLLGNKATSTLKVLKASRTAPANDVEAAEDAKFTALMDEGEAGPLADLFYSLSGKWQRSSKWLLDDALEATLCTVQTKQGVV